MRNVEIDLLQHGSLQSWSPKIGDVVFKDGLFFRWCAIVEGIKGDNISVRIAGNMHLMSMGEYKSEVINFRKIKNARLGNYFVCSDGIYYV
jgi:hypothetical protein